MRARVKVWMPPHWAESFRELVRPMSSIEKLRARKAIQENLSAEKPKEWRAPPATYHWERLF
jgi:hypothetical protein